MGLEHDMDQLDRLIYVGEVHHDVHGQVPEERQQ